MKKIIILLFFVIVLSNFVSALNTTDIIAYYKFDGNLLDASDNSLDITSSNLTTTSGQVVNQWLDCTGSDYGVIPLMPNGINTFSFWLKPSVNYTSGSGITGFINNASGNQGFFFGAYTGLVSGETITLTQDGNSNFFWWTQPITSYLNHYLFIWNATSTTYDLWINNTYISAGTKKGNPSIMNNWGINRICYYVSNQYAGYIDELAFINKTLNSTERALLFNKTQYPFVPANTTVNESTERTIVNRQSSTVTFLTTPTTIVNVSFNVSNNNSPLYISQSMEINKISGSALNTNVFCELSVDSTVIKNITRSMPLNQAGNMYIMSNNLSLNTGSHYFDLVCSRISGDGQIRIGKTVSIGHILVDEQNKTLNYDYKNINTINLSSTSYVNLSTFTFTASNVSVNDSIHSKDLIFDFNSEYGNGQYNKVFTKIVVDGVDCIEIPRAFSSSNTKGVVGGQCIVQNVSQNQNLTVNIQGKGQDAVIGGTINSIIDYNLIIKEFVNDISEVNFTSLTNTSITSNSLTKLKTLTITNSDHDDVDLVFIASIPVYSNTTSTYSNFMLEVVNSVGRNSSSYNRSLSAFSSYSRDGVLVIQDVFESAPIDTYTVSLYGSCGNSNCTISDGGLLTYFSNIKSEIFQGFNVSAIDYYDNSSILNFNVTDGSSTFSSTTGSLIFFSNNGLINLTVSSDYNGGFFQRVITNHNTSNNLNVSMNQTIINWDCFEKVSGLSLTCLNPLSTTYFNYNVVGNPHSQSVNVTGYYENTTTFNVTALQNNTLNATFFSTNLSLNTVSPDGVVSSCTYIITSLNYTFQENVTGSPSGWAGLINGTYNITADCVGFAYNTSEVTVNTDPQSFNFTVRATNSVNMSFYYENTPTTLFNNTVTFSLLNGGASNYTTSTGYNFLANLTIGDYEIRYKSTGYDERSMFFTITNRSTQVLSFFVSNSSETTNYIIRVADQSDSDKIGAKVLLQRQYIEFNGSYRTIEECLTNTDGECDFFIQESSEIVYRFIVVIDDVIVKTTTQQNIVNIAGVTTKQITLRISTGTSFLDAYNTILGLFGQVNYDNSTKIVNYSFVDSKNAISAGCLVIKRNLIRNTTQTTLQTSCVSASTGDISINVSSYIINGTVLSMIGIVNYTDTFIVLDEVKINTLDRGANYDEDTSLLFTALFFVMISFATVMIPNVLIQVIINFTLLFGISFLGVNLLSTALIILFMSVGLIVNYTKKNAEGDLR